MSTEVLGLFDSLQAAELAKKSLVETGFTNSQITLQSFDDSETPDGRRYSQKLAHGQSLVAVVSSDNVAEDKALHILRESGAVKVNEIETRFHADSKAS